MSFELGSDIYTLHGDPTLAWSRISLKAMIRTLRIKGEGLWLELNQVEYGHKTTSSQTHRAILAFFTGFFATPQVLPEVT